MPERGRQEESPNEIELDIIRSFGWAVVELEETLYERFLHLSARRSIMSLDAFKSHLKEMEAKGWISPIHLHGFKGYKKLLAEKDDGKSLEPKIPLDEIRLALGSKKALPKMKPEETTKINRELLDKSETVGQAIQMALEAWMLREKGRISKGQVHEHMKNMCHALSESEEDLFEYVRTQTPGILIEVGQILRSRGSDFLLLSLRLSEASMRKYSY
ncbi:hypothetical protein EU527_12935 [Candidatus Thorarchaeota archaeon]|nr:MAG: hypothetical protein EU527_12935 [Candidatus Thorarchaeota archaeon]